MTLASSTDNRRYVLTLGCPDTTGIVARISTFLADVGGSIMEAAYHADQDSGWFFTRQAVRASSIPFSIEELRAQFAAVAEAIGPETEWTLSDTGKRKRVVLLVSKEAHCLHDILGRVAAGELEADVCAVIGNHPELESVARRHGIDFHYVSFPKDPAERGPAFEQVRKLVDAHDPHAVVLARFMQVLPQSLCEHWAGRAINIHHSFLPSFIGARPYHQAFTRGVKLIGATCHYVTAELDAGPIIEQDVIRVSHSDSVNDMVRQGRDVEKLVLARGLRWHLEDRVLVHDSKTVVFS
ncbi:MULTISPECIES: formyltetrahydrofolate deformylase [unclassified Rhodococcus (in: high G+C Gram-positive bacteria)]|jgi:formyltetrahydrofolate deformylase|uniref:formyltetrahydrofolate deformylase n=1 Tax=unclassified Rhodococcus (in: high G+C Gram-positive bacteria) TaxID=192944 RepID=UPI00146A4BCF|nr:MULTISPECIES: formyltetrahydrofolate deformylase [unclassified Rhodococcus (in: high G+C Gram-positive bacteria)]MBF0661009.1 formyltetrahydrofolate deformylase [Rhodococcus sp. (in: high G+C Gram-positive bacteria)]NMD94110.1 formyltetrahydrofolate deformylase [Rhodococcus sp. BL-253-APC-6A1W]NME77644.1 formyltetrahydrofolate deformylase [Rhodococcus sp. 105337]